MEVGGSRANNQMSAFICSLVPLGYKMTATTPEIIALGDSVQRLEDEERARPFLYLSFKTFTEGCGMFLLISPWSGSPLCRIHPWGDYGPRTPKVYGHLISKLN